MIPEKAVILSQATLKDVSAGISGLTEDGVTTLVTPKGHSGVKRADNRLQAVLPGVVKNTLDENLNFVEVEYRILRKTEKAKPSRRKVKKMTGAMLYYQAFTAHVETIDTKESKKAVNVEWESGNQHLKFVEVAYCTGAWSAPSSY